MRNSILNLIRNAKPRYLNDGTINMLLANYELTPGQIAWLIDFFRSRRQVGKMRENHMRAVSWSMNSGSSFPSLSLQKSSLLGGPVVHISQFGIDCSVNNLLTPVVKTRQLRQSNSSSRVVNPRLAYGTKGNPGELSLQIGGHPGMKSFRHPADIETNPNKQLPKSTLSNNTNPHVFDPTTGFDKNENSRARYEEGYGKFGQDNLAHLIPILENFNPINRNDGSPTNQGRTPNETVEEDSNLILSSLTEQNLLLYNRLKPPLKGDFTTIVRTWLQKSAA